MIRFVDADGFTHVLYNSYCEIHGDTAGLCGRLGAEGLSIVRDQQRSLARYLATVKPNPIMAEAIVSATTSAGKAARDGEDRSCGPEPNFFGRHRAEGVTGVTGVTTETYTSNRLRPLTVTDPFAPLPYSSYALPFAKLQAECPPSVETIAWRQAIVDSRDFQNRWGRIAKRLANLLTVDQFTDYSGIAWRRAQAGALAFALEWGSRALEAGWRPNELFGLHPVAPSARYDCKGLAWVLNDRWRVVAIEKDLAAIRTDTGSTLSYHRQKPGLLGDPAKNSSPIRDDPISKNSEGSCMHDLDPQPGAKEQN